MLSIIGAFNQAFDIFKLFYKISLYMNKNVTKPSSPSPISNACRKPLLNITNLVHTSQSAMLVQQKQGISRPESTKNVRPRISIDQFSKPKLKQIHSRRSNRSDSQDSTSSQNQQKHCRNHKNRTAMHQMDSTSTEYLCLQCSLVYAKQGYKIKPLHSNVNEKTNREKQTTGYLQKSNSIKNELMNWRSQQNKAVKQIFEQFGELINSHKIKMEEQINNLRQRYQHQIKQVEKNRQEKIKKFKDIDGEVEKICNLLDSTRVDIQRNYEDCIRSFSTRQYRAIMDEYWKQVNHAEQFLKIHSITTLIKQCQVDIKMTVKTMGRSQNINNQFTFSKEKKFQTPPFSKQLRGIKIVESQPDSNRYDSSLKESVVDSKINFSQFNI